MFMRRTAICLPSLDSARNTRGDEYGGGMENRVRLVRELIEEFKDAIGDKCRCRATFADDQVGEDGIQSMGERRDMEMLAPTRTYGHQHC
jgi:dimethylamine/trimethylamine dehydrogenase